MTDWEEFKDYWIGRYSFKMWTDRRNNTMDVAQWILESPETNDKDMRAYIAMNFFVTMRCALDYMNMAKIMIAEWKIRTKQKERCEY